MGSMKKLTDNPKGQPDSYKLTVSNGFKANGERDRKYRTIKAMSDREAKKQLALFESEVERGEYVKPTHTTFQEYSKTWEERAERRVSSGKLAPKTFHRYSELLRLHINPVLGSRQLENIDYEVIEDAYDELRKPRIMERTRKDGKKITKEYTLSEMTIQHIHRLISTILQSAFKKGLIKENPVSKVDAPRPAKHEMEVYDTEQIAALFEALEDTDIQFKVAVHVTLAAGLRLGELCGLEFSDIDYKNKTITIRRSSQYVAGLGIITKDPKNETSKRTVSVPDPVLNLIKQLERDHKLRKLKLGTKWNGGSMGDDESNNKPNRLMIQWDGSPMYPATPSNQWREFLEAKGLPMITFHQLRHTSASYQIASGLDVVSLAKRLGHSNSNTTLSVYSHAFKKRDEEAANNIAKLYAKKDNANNKAN